MRLLEPLAIGGRASPNRVLFGPHETNLGDGRATSARHAAYYRERAVGGAGIIVTEEASVHSSDWPYERAPLATDSAAGWRLIADACVDTQALVIAALGHSGGQGSSAFSQRELWAPSDEPEVDSGEVPKIMELADIAAVVDGFGASARLATGAGLDGVELNAGQHSLIRQFLSGLTNRRGDDYDTDRLRFARDVIRSVRSAIPPDAIIGLRLSCDEMAPWAGVTPEAAAEIAAELGPLVDYLVVVRGSIFTVAETRPTGHHRPGFNLDLVAAIRESVGGSVPVFAQGSIVDAAMAEDALMAGRCDGVEMTRAQIADPNLVTKVTAGLTPRPCVLCNQRCRVRDNRNPIVSCIAEPRAGYETIDPLIADNPALVSTDAAPLLIVGAGPAGLEAARTAALEGRAVTVMEATSSAGGLLRDIAVGPGNDRFGLLAGWFVEEMERLGVDLQFGRRATEDEIRAWPGPVVLAIGGRRVEANRHDPLSAGPERPPVRAALDILRASREGTLDAVAGGRVAVWDPVGNSVGVGVAELLAAHGRQVAIITPDPIAGTLLSLTGDLAGANVRLQQAGVAIERRQRVRSLNPEGVVTEHIFTKELTTIATDTVVDCSHRVPSEAIDVTVTASGHPVVRIGDAVAARTVGEAVREGRSAVLSPTADPIGAPA